MVEDEFASFNIRGTFAHEKLLLFSQWNLVFSAKPLWLFKCHSLAFKTGKRCQGAKNILETVLGHVCDKK